MAINLCRRLAFLLLFPLALAAWQTPVKLPTTGQLREHYIRLNSGNTAYIAYIENYVVKLAKYDGQKFTYIGQVSDGSRQAYLPTIRFSADNDVHLVWGEAVTLADADNSVMYRRFSEASGWSPISQLWTYNIPKPHRKGPLASKMEQLRFELDKDNNLYIVSYEAPSLRCNLLTRYGSEVSEETWPDPFHIRTQTPDIVVDDTDVHVTWNQFLYNSDGSYSIYYSKRPVGKANTGLWSLPLDIKSGIQLNKNVHRPRIALDEDKTPYVLYMQDTSSGTERVMYIRYLNGPGFGGLYDLSHDVTRTYNNLNLEIASSANILVVAHGALNTYYNWLINGRWSGLNPIDVIPAYADVECASLSRDGSLAVISYSPIVSSGGITGGMFFNEIRITSNKAWKGTQAPLAVINADATEIYWDEQVRFDGSGSSDSDGTIVNYQWVIEQDHVTLDGPVVSYRFNKNYGAVKVKLIVTDDQGARGSAEKIINVKALFTPRATWSKKKITTLVYNREGYVIQWEPNAKNDAAGYRIAKYKIFRKEGSGDYMEIGEVGAEKKAYADIRIEAGKTYSYAVSAVDDQGRRSPYDNY